MTRSAPGPAQHPEHRISVGEPTESVEVRVGSCVLARSRRALRMDEQGHPPRWYIPREDVAMDLLTSSSTTTHCPFKGEALHWSYIAADDTLIDIAWSYPDPYREMLPIAGRIAFDDSRVTVVRE